MTLYEASETLRVLKSLTYKGGATYLKVSRMLGKEATTDNIKEAEELLRRLNGN